MAKTDFKIGKIYEIDGIHFRLIRMRSGLVKVFQQLNPDGTDFQVCRQRPDGTFGAIVDFGVRVIHARIDEVKEVQTEQQQKLFE